VKTTFPLLLFFLSGCLLEPSDCGPSFQAQSGRCEPATAPPQYTPLTADKGPTQTERPGLDAGGQLDQGIEPDASYSVDGTIVPDMATPWAAYENLLVVDRTTDGDARQTPALPGADIDGVLIKDERGEFIGTAQEVIDARINDPYQANIQLEPSAALRMPDGRAVSLGTQGGFVRLRLELSRSLLSGDLVEVVELRERSGDADKFEVFLCRSDADGLRGCIILGIGGSGSTRFLVP
jgi:hypothetical protein